MYGALESVTVLWRPRNYRDAHSADRAEDVAVLVVCQCFPRVFSRIYSTTLKLRSSNLVYMKISRHSDIAAILGPESRRSRSRG